MRAKKVSRTFTLLIALLLVLPFLGACGGSSTASAKNSGPVWGFPFKTGMMVTLGSFGLHDDNYGSMASSNGTFFFDGAGTVKDASLDLLPQGSSVPVIPLASGTVFATWPTCHLVVVDHGGGVLVEYLHLNVSVQPGQTVTRDIALGTTTTSVSTGRPCNEVSEGANGQPVEHVHFAFLTRSNATPPYSASNTAAAFQSMIGKVLCGYQVIQNAGYSNGALQAVANTQHVVTPNGQFSVPDCPSSSGQSSESVSPTATATNPPSTSVTGKWNMTIGPLSNGSRGGSCVMTLQQSGASVAGESTCAGGNGDQLPLTGSISGNDIQLTASERASSSQIFDYTFSGTLDDSFSTIQGTFTEVDNSGINSTLEGPWTATKTG